MNPAIKMAQLQKSVTRTRDEHAANTDLKTALPPSGKWTDVDQTSRVSAVPSVFGRVRKAFLKHGALFASLVAVIVPIGVMMSAQGIANFKALLDGVLVGDKLSLLFAGLAAGYVHLAALTWVQVLRSDKDDSAREEMLKGERELRAHLQEAMQSVSHSWSRAHRETAWMRELICGSANISLLLDEESLWKNAFGTFTAVNSTFLREVSVKSYHDGSWSFEASDRLRNVILERLELGAGPSIYNVILYVPPVAKAFESFAALPARKLIFLCDQAQVLAAKAKKKLDFTKLRICVVRASPPPYSFFCVTRETPYGYQDVVLTYIRGLTDPRVHAGAGFFDRYVLEIREEAIVGRLQAEAEDTRRLGVVMTLDELRDMCGSVPTSTEVRMPASMAEQLYDRSVVSGDHFVL
jgi:hypothetical protein